ncbi:STE/STE20 protein kinase [Purpureocillium lavendulum]|uniref:STE/STE20 protein kinase n=1 Tax=Purpureocillium lavendulum TaxID=1247861 RepID=A0AB34FBC1_9HYPO|nr:STE/STE20 protein kinase [Purpureocillium lavendulum]
MILQLGISVIPLAFFGDWGVFAITFFGNLLSIATGLLPQWKAEKWACRKDSTKTYVMTRGNGAQHAIVILGNGRGLNLEDLASGQSNIEVATNKFTRFALLALFLLWIMLLITAAGLKENSWFLLAVGAVGIVQNAHVAGHPRKPENYGIPLDFVQVVGHAKVMDTLLDLESNYEHVGRAILPEFFPGRLTAAEKVRWEVVRQSHRQAHCSEESNAHLSVAIGIGIDTPTT